MAPGQTMLVPLLAGQHNAPDTDKHPVCCRCGGASRQELRDLQPFRGVAVVGQGSEASIGLREGDVRVLHALLGLWRALVLNTAAGFELSHGVAQRKGLQDKPKSNKPWHCLMAIKELGRPKMAWRTEMHSESVNTMLKMAAINKRELAQSYLWSCFWQCGLGR